MNILVAKRNGKLNEIQEFTSSKRLSMGGRKILKLRKFSDDGPSASEPNSGVNLPPRHSSKKFSQMNFSPPPPKMLSKHSSSQVFKFNVFPNLEEGKQ